MSPEAQRIAIAEACGVSPARRGWWAYNPTTNGIALSEDTRKRVEQWIDAGYNRKNEYEVREWLEYPDYLNDLNAMHSAIMSQPEPVRVSINHTLMEMLRPDEKLILDRTINATAAQRAEAFLRTIGKWQEKCAE